jgi:hypothetical protein
MITHTHTYIYIYNDNTGTIADPNGVQIEIIDGTDANTHPEAKLRLSVLDLDESIDFYSK